jgi:hypothetical protein
VTVTLRSGRPAGTPRGGRSPEVAKHFEQRQAFVSKCESGERRIDPIDLAKFARLYKQPVDFFLDGD